MKGHCSQVVCQSVTQFSLVLHALWRRFLDHSTLRREILLCTIYFSSHDSVIGSTYSSHFVSIGAYAQRELGGCVCASF